MDRDATPNLMPRFKIKDIASISGLSPSTVSRVINNSDKVKMQTRKAVVDAIRKLGHNDKGLSGPDNVIGLILGDMRNPYYSNIVFTLQEILIREGYMLMQFNSTYDESKELQFIDFTAHAAFSGLILISALNSELLREKIESLSCPVVLLDRIIQNYTGHAVIQDNFHGGYLAANHLIELGYPSIAYIAGPTQSTSSMKRLEGFMQALRNYYIPFNEENLWYGDLTLECGTSIGWEYIRELKNRPKAVVIGNDLMAIGFMDACHNAGVLIPDHLSLVSFDDIPFAALKAFEITTIRQPVMEMCKAAADTMLTAIRNPNTSPIRVILEPELVIRSTTAPYIPEIL